MDGVLATQSLKPFSDVNDSFHVRVSVVHLAELRCSFVPVDVLFFLVEAGPKRSVPTHHQRRHCFGNLVTHGIGIAEDSSGISNRGACFDSGKGDDLGDVFSTVGLGCVADHFVPITVVEIHVDVGHGLSARVQESLEQKIVFDWIQVGDL